MSRQSQYINAALVGLSEEELQDFLEFVFKKQRWLVRNLHQIDRSAENGVDLDLNRGGDRVLIAVKAKPKTKDIDQLERLAARHSEGRLEYVHSQPATERFRKKALSLSNVVFFLTGNELHDFLIRGECVSYVNRILETHPLLREYSDSLGLIWKYRKVSVPGSYDQNDLDHIYRLKDILVKKRAGIAQVFLHYDKTVNSLISPNQNDFSAILDDVLSDMDLVQQFAGGNLFSQFEHISDISPYILSLFWSKISPRTYWDQFTSISERLHTSESVSTLARRYWLLPNKESIGQARLLSSLSLGFLSGLHNSLESITAAFKSMDDVIDWIWEAFTHKTA